MLFVFDLDGTLMDTSQGIINCYNFAAANFGVKPRAANSFRGVIGGPLLQNFQKYYEMDETSARQAVNIYRQKYAEQGIFEAKVYCHIPELLSLLKRKGQKVAVATLKREDFAHEMLKHFNLAQYFDVICGIDQKDQQTKADLICRCIQWIKVSKDDCVLIGDSIHDAIGAKQVGIPFVGVSYGWGFENIDQIKAGYHTYAANSVEALKILLETMIK